MALAQSSHTPLQPATRAILNDHLGDNEVFPVRLAAAYALIRSRDENGHEVLIRLMDESVPLEVHKAVLFILATEPPIHFPYPQQEHSHYITFARSSSH